MKVATATSKAAELERPLPRGTSEEMTASKENDGGSSPVYW